MMRKEIYLNFLVFCTILPQGLGILSNVNIKESSDLHVRKKRIIDLSLNRDQPMMTEKVPYIVNILQNGVSACGGSILSTNIVLSAAHCFLERKVKYSLLSGSRYVDRGVLHKIMRKIIYPEFRAHMLANDLALLIISPNIDLVHSPNRQITLYNGIVRPNTIGTFSGWGLSHVEGNKSVRPYALRIINVPIMSNEECENAYRNFTTITNKDICTFDTCREKCGSYGDSGGPLVVNGKLVGIMAWNRMLAPEEPVEHPDVFVNLSYRPYRDWIFSIMHDFRV